MKEESVTDKERFMEMLESAGVEHFTARGTDVVIPRKAWFVFNTNGKFQRVGRDEDDYDND